MEPLPQNGAYLLSPWEPGLLGLAVYAGAALLMLAAILILTSWLGEHKPGPAKDLPYESGILPTGSPRILYAIPFYLVATFFLIFDVEALYVFSWAVAFNDLGWTGWLQMSVFIAVLFISLIYVWKKGGLDWGPESRK